MWYVIQTLKGHEYKVAEDVRDKVATNDEPVFIMESELEFKIKGKWEKRRKPLFPGYIFVDLDKESADDFNRRLHSHDYTLKLMGMDGIPKAIETSEQEYLLKLAGDEHVIRHSVGFRVEDMVEIAEGSFKGFTGEIKKLDRHNRRAKVCVPFMGKDTPVYIGLEIVKNITFAELSPDEQIERMAKIVPE